jgi:spore germination protein KB
LKLSGLQLLWITVTTEVVAIIGLRISPAIVISKQDAWLSMLVASGIGAAITFLFVRLSLLHPKQTLTQFSQNLLGKWIGRIIVLPYLLAWYLASAGLLRSFVDFFHLILVTRTPQWIIMLLLLGLTIYITYSAGITGIGRYCELMGPIIIFVLLLSFVLNIGNMDFHHLLPVYFDSGWLNIVKGSLAPAFYFAGPFALLVLISFMPNPQKALSKSMLGVAVSAIMVFTATLMVLLIFGPALSAKLRFSYFMYVRTIDIFNFIQNVDIVIMFVWIFGVSAELSLYFFIFSYETAHWLNVKNWKQIIWFSAPAIFILAVSIPNENVFTLMDEFWNSVIYPVCGIGIPLLLWLLSAIKKKYRKDPVRQDI